MVTRDGLQDRLHVPILFAKSSAIAFEARDDHRVDNILVFPAHAITVHRVGLSNARRRALLTAEEEIVPRISDITAATPSMTAR